MDWIIKIVVLLVVIGIIMKVVEWISDLFSFLKRHSTIVKWVLGLGLLVFFSDEVWAGLGMVFPREDMLYLHEEWARGTIYWLVPLFLAHCLYDYLIPRMMTGKKAAAVTAIMLGGATWVFMSPMHLMKAFVKLPTISQYFLVGGFLLVLVKVLINFFRRIPEGDIYRTAAANLYYRTLMAKPFVFWLDLLTLFMIFFRSSVINSFAVLVLGYLALRKVAESPEVIANTIYYVVMYHGRLEYDKVPRGIGKSILTPEEKDVFVNHLIKNGHLININGMLYDAKGFRTALDKELRSSHGYTTVYDVYRAFNDARDKELPDLYTAADREMDMAAFRTLCPEIAEGYYGENGLHCIFPAPDSTSYEVKVQACEYCGTIFQLTPGARYCCDKCAAAAASEERTAQELLNNPARSHISLNLSLQDGGIYARNDSAQVIAAQAAAETDRGHMMSTPQGHGFAAEECNTLIDNLQGDDAQVVGYDNAKSGADRLVNGKLIQTKYYQNASGSVAACFENGSYKYLKANGRPMQVEVPADQYSHAVQLMKKRIADGQVPGISDPRYASRLVRRGHLTYAQAKAAASFGTIESLTMDVANGIVNVSSGLGISMACQIAVSIWNGKNSQEIVENACRSMIAVGGTGVVVSVVSAQLMRTSVGAGIRSATGAIVQSAGEVVLSRSTASALSTLAKSNVITQSVMLGVMNLNNLNAYMDKKISGKELAANVAADGTTLAGVAAGGAFLGGTIGSIVPVGGTLIGGCIGGFLGSVLGEMLFGPEKMQVERLKKENEDIKKFVDILNVQFTRWSVVFLLTEEEIKRVAEGIQTYMDRDDFLEMARSSNSLVSEATIYLRRFIIPVISERPVVDTVDTVLMERELTGYVAQMNAQA